MAADQNEPSAQNNLGYMFEAGLGINKDIAKALYYYKLSAKQGISHGIDNLTKNNDSTKLLLFQILEINFK